MGVVETVGPLPGIFATLTSLAVASVALVAAVLRGGVGGMGAFAAALIAVWRGASALLFAVGVIATAANGGPDVGDGGACCAAAVGISWLIGAVVGGIVPLAGDFAVPISGWLAGGTIPVAGDFATPIRGWLARACCGVPTDDVASSMGVTSASVCPMTLCRVAGDGGMADGNRAAKEAAFAIAFWLVVGSDTDVGAWADCPLVTSAVMGCSVPLPGVLPPLPWCDVSARGGATTAVVAGKSNGAPRSTPFLAWVGASFSAHTGWVWVASGGSVFFFPFSDAAGWGGGSPTATAPGCGALAAGGVALSIMASSARNGDVGCGADPGPIMSADTPALVSADARAWPGLEMVLVIVVAVLAIADEGDAS